MVTNEIALPATGDIELNYYTWYYTETGYDYGYVEITKDDGATWDQLEVMEGPSEGWVNRELDLSEYAGENVKIRFNYQTDGGYLEEGIYLDEIKVLVDGIAIFEDFADSRDNWSTSEWQQYEGYFLADNYYLIEWRNHNNTDEGLMYGYNWVDYDNGVCEYYRIEPGMMIWYVNDAYTDNWVGVHPGYGFLGVVDAHPKPIVAKGADIRTRLQNHDAAFSFDRVQDKTLTLYGQTKVLQGSQAVPEFNDSHSYWNPKAPSAGLKLPTNGLKIKVVGQSNDKTTAEIVIYK
jgi:immune inhibitor A